MIVDKVDLSTAQQWSNVDNVEIGPSAQSTWDGLSNSNAIVGQAGHTNSAAALCLNSTNGGYTDWYLPAIDELERLYTNRLEVNATLRGISGASELKRYDSATQDYVFYWSSAEYYFNAAWIFNFRNGDVYYDNKYDTYYVRAVRAF